MADLKDKKDEISNKPVGSDKKEIKGEVADKDLDKVAGGWGTWHKQN
jgi:hypothetical protein